MGPNGIFVCLVKMNLRTNFRWSMCMWEAGLNNRGRYRACMSQPHTMTSQIFSGDSFYIPEILGEIGNCMKKL